MRNKNHMVIAQNCAINRSHPSIVRHVLLAHMTPLYFRSNLLLVLGKCIIASLIIDFLPLILIAYSGDLFRNCNIELCSQICLLEICISQFLKILDILLRLSYLSAISAVCSWNNILVCLSQWLLLSFFFILTFTHLERKVHSISFLLKRGSNQFLNSLCGSPWLLFSS